MILHLEISTFSYLENIDYVQKLSLIDNFCRAEPRIIGNFNGWKLSSGFNSLMLLLRLDIKCFRNLID